MIRIRGQYKDKQPETVDTATSEQDAQYLLGEYRLAFGRDWKLWITGLPRKRERRLGYAEYKASR